jgi:uncharacterized membrane protein YqjE
MNGKTARFRNPAGRAGLMENLLALGSSLADFFESRFALFAHESKGAVVQLAVIAACLMLAVVLCLFGYIFLIASAIVGVARLAGISWLWTALAAAGAHFVTALILLAVARSRISKPVFRAASSALKEDREWLKNLNATNQPTS